MTKNSIAHRKFDDGYINLNQYKKVETVFPEGKQREALIDAIQ